MILIKPISEIMYVPSIGAYEMLLAFSSDTIHVVDEEITLVESVRQGTDKNGYLCQCSDENDFLETLLLITNMIDKKENPVKYFNL